LYDDDLWNQIVSKLCNALPWRKEFVDNAAAFKKAMDLVREILGEGEESVHQ
jgi:hypothetical protein